MPSFPIRVHISAPGVCVTARCRCSLNDMAGPQLTRAAGRQRTSKTEALLGVLPVKALQTGVLGAGGRARQRGAVVEDAWRHRFDAEREFVAGGACAAVG